MTIPREGVMQAIAAALTADRAARGGSFERNRIDKHRPAEMPGVVLWDGAQRVLDIDTGGMQRELDVDVDLYVTAADGAALGLAISTEAALVSKAVMADQTCGGFAREVFEVDMTTPDFSDEGQTLIAEFSLRFRAVFETAELDPSTAP